jgi:hypothetical protein
MNATKPKSFLGIINDGVFSSAEQQMVGEGVEAATKIGASVIQGISQNKAFDSAQEIARNSAMDSRNIQLSTLEMQNKARREEIEQEKENMALNKLEYSQKRIMQSFLEDFQRRLEIGASKQEIGDNIINGMKADKQKAIALLEMWRR